MKKMYHATHISNRDSILEKGLEPRLSNRFNFDYEEGRIFLYEDLKSNALDFVGYFNIDIWEVDIDDSYVLNEDLIAKKDGVDKCYYVTKHIPPEKIKIHQSLCND